MSNDALKNGKAAGVDGMVKKNGGGTAVEWILKVYLEAWKISVCLMIGKM